MLEVIGGLLFMFFIEIFMMEVLLCFLFLIIIVKL